MTRRAAAWLLSLIMIAPLLVLGLLSVAVQWRYPSLWPSAFHHRLWLDLLHDGSALGLAFLASGLIAAAVSVLATVGGLCTSERIARHQHHSALLRLAVLPFAVSPVVMALSLDYGFIRLHWAGTVPGLILAQTLFAYAYATLLLNSLWSPRMVALSNLAASLGASRRQLWTRVRLPLGSAVIGVCLFQTFLMSWFDFALARIIGAGRVVTLPIKVFEYFGSGDLRLAAASGLLLMLPPMLMLVLNRKGLAWPLAHEASA